MKSPTSNHLPKSTQTKIDFYVSKIGKGWNKAVVTIFSVGDLLIKARKQFRDDETYETLINQLSFGERTAQKLRAIAGDTKLRNPKVLNKLPASWGTLDILHSLTDDEFKEALKRGWINQKMLRKDAETISKRLKESTSGTSIAKNNSRSVSHSSEDSKDNPNVTSSATNKKGDGKLALTIHVTEKLTDAKTIIDLHFFYLLISTILRNAREGHKVKLTPYDGMKLSEKGMKSYKVYRQLILLIRKLENHYRAKANKQELNELQAQMSLFGADPDRVSENGFCLTESIALAYASRLKLSPIEESKLRWFAGKRSTEPELLGSFIDEVEEEVLSKIKD